jgi:hypothetical protein
MSQLIRSDNFKFVQLVSVLHDAEEAGVKDELFM